MSLKLKSEVLAAFKAAGINIGTAVVNTTCSVLISGRYVAWYGAHQGWQIGKDRSPKGRVVVTEAQAKAWANDGVWADGSPCKHGYAVVDGVEKGRKTPIEAAPDEAPSALVNPAIDLASVVVELAKAGKTKEEIVAVIAALKA